MQDTTLMKRVVAQILYQGDTYTITYKREDCIQYGRTLYRKRDYFDELNYH